MDPRGGRLPPFLRPATNQPKITAFIDFFRSTDLTVLLVAACILLGAVIAIGVSTVDVAPEVRHTAALG